MEVHDHTRFIILKGEREIRGFILYAQIEVTCIMKETRGREREPERARACFNSYLFFPTMYNVFSLLDQAFTVQYMHDRCIKIANPHARARLH
jgi:hypothetical protein